MEQRHRELSIMCIRNVQSKNAILRTDGIKIYRARHLSGRPFELVQNWA